MLFTKRAVVALAAIAAASTGVSRATKIVESEPVRRAKGSDSKETKDMKSTKKTPPPPEPTTPPAKAKGSKAKGAKSKPTVELFHEEYDFSVNDSPESIVFDSKGNAYVSLTLTAFISVLDPHGKEITRIDLPQGYCRPEGPTDISFPLSSLQFGMAMSKDDTLYVSLLACAEGFPQPPNPNPNTGLWMVNTHDYSIKQIAKVPNADGRSRQDFCCEWNQLHWNDADPPYVGKKPDGTCDEETCCFYEAQVGSALFGIDFCGYAEIWNGIEVIGDCVYATNSYFHEIWRVCPPENGSEDLWTPELWMEYGYMDSPDLIRLKDTFFTAAGFNGIKYFDGDIYVANTAQGKIIKIPMVAENGYPMPSKSSKASKSTKSMRGLVPGKPELVYEGGDVDEFVLDQKGNIYAALFEDNKVMKISPDGTSETLVDGGPTYNNNCPPPFGFGEYVESYNPSPELDLPTSVAFGTNGKTNEMTLYIANSGFVFFKSCAGNPIPVTPDGPYVYYDAYPGIARIYVGEKGEKQQF